MPFSGGVLEFAILNIIPSSVYGYEMFNFFFTLMVITGIISWGLGQLFGLLGRIK